MCNISFHNLHLYQISFKKWSMGSARNAMVAYQSAKNERTWAESMSHYLENSVSPQCSYAFKTCQANQNEECVPETLKRINF